MPPARSSTGAVMVLEPDDMIDVAEVESTMIPPFTATTCVEPESVIAVPDGASNRMAAVE